MQCFLRWVASVLGALACLHLGGVAAQAERRVALVIGNASYGHYSSLPNVPNDAAAMAALFKAAKFDAVEVKHNLGIAELRWALREFSRQAAGADVAVLFFAGHGIEVDRTNYLIPVDARLAADLDVEDETVSLDRVLHLLEPAKRLRLVILDACRENPFAAGMKRTVATRSVGRGLARIEPQSSNTLIAYATKANAVAEDGKGANSPFTAALVKHLTAPGLDLRIALGHVRDEVLAATGNKQEPYFTGSLGGGILSLTGPPQPTGLPQTSAAALEWARVDKSSLAELQTFRRRHPSSPEAEYANARIEELERQKTALAVPPQPVKPAPVTPAFCAEKVTFACLRAGLVRGHILSGLEQVQCAEERIYGPDELDWRSIWTTSVYSYAPGGGGPGGGLEDDKLRIGGWGDQYYSLIRFDTPKLSRPVRFAAVLLFAKTEEGTPTAMHLDRINRTWAWKAGDRLWWKDRPGATFVASMPQPVANDWYVIEISQLLEDWRLGLIDNHGLQIRPAANNHNFNAFHSTRSADLAKRPRLLVCT